MLIDNKFLYISLPRCGSTSFHYSCLLNGLSVQMVHDIWKESNSKINFTNINESEIMNVIGHGHEALTDLKEKFGNHLPVIAVNRDRHESFFSLYKHVIFDLKRTGWPVISDWLSNIELEDLFFYESKDLTTIEKRRDVINNYLIKNGFITTPISQYITSSNYITPQSYLINILDILITPKSIWHNNDKEIIWFNMDEMGKMEEWVSDVTDRSFKLKHVNSSSYVTTKLQLNDEFKKKYNSIYDYYDLPKERKTII